jgi:hypothetical protein
VTIAAGQSASPADGLFKLTDGSSYASSFPVHWPSTGETDTMIVDMSPQLRYRSTNSMTVGPLSKRGWTLQESVLSHRILHICGSGTLFECAGSDVTDRLPWPKPVNTGNDMGFPKGFLHFDDPDAMLHN